MKRLGVVHSVIDLLLPAPVLALGPLWVGARE